MNIVEYCISVFLKYTIDHDICFVIFLKGLRSSEVLISVFILIKYFKVFRLISSSIISRGVWTRLGAYAPAESKQGGRMG